MSFDVYTALLKMFDEFHVNSDGVNLCFDLNNPNFQEIKLKYNLDNIVGEGNDFSKVTNLLFWLSKNCYHNENCDNNGDLNPINLLKFSFQKGKEFGINCRCLSTILTECLLSLGFMARTMYIMPFSPYDYDNHVVTHVFINDLKKWIMLDPTYSCYVMDREKNPLNIFEIRELLANQDYIVFNRLVRQPENMI